MQIKTGRSGKKWALIVPIPTVTPNNELLKAVEKNTSYFFLEPDELEALQQATLQNVPVTDNDLSNIEIVVGVWNKNSDRKVIASIYYVVQADLTIDDGLATWTKGKYLDELSEFADCRIGDDVTGLPDDLESAGLFSIDKGD